MRETEPRARDNRSNGKLKIARKAVANNRKVRGMKEEWSDWEERSGSRRTVRVTASDSGGVSEFQLRGFF